MNDPAQPASGAEPAPSGDPSSRATPVTLEAGLVVADRFQLVHPLGQGGMGAVWAAQHTELETPCALKFMHDAAAQVPEVAARFKREAKAAAQLRSPHVVQVLDHGVWHGTPYIAMELLEGEDLSRRLKRMRTLPPREVVSIASQVGRALTKAHAAGLVHRDLKPANIFLVRDDEREIAKVLDFGVAKVTAGSPLADSNTQTGTVLGTPFYMSPEHLRGEKGIDHRADLWALAVVVYQCLVGKLPFRGDTLAEIIVKIMVDPLPMPSHVAPERALPAGFEAWWARSVDRDITKRFQTAKELTEALALALDVSLSMSSGTIADVRASLPAAPVMTAGATLPLPPAHDAGATIRMPVTPFPQPAPAAPVEELDSGLLHTAMPTVTPSLPTSSGQHQATLPPELRRKPPTRLLVAAGAVVAVAIVALVAFRGGEPAAGARDDVPAASPPTPPETPAPAAAPSSVVAPAPAPSATAATEPSATASASASAAPASPPAHPASKGGRPAAAAAPAAAAGRPAGTPRPKHEGVTDF